MLEMIIVFAIVLIAGIYLFKKLHTSFTKPYEGCANCSCKCSSFDQCDSKPTK
jgi:hypothetical protein